MKLKKLYIHNIASISDAMIDFDGPVLSNEPLFLICGETGAGKTTILDAICLALYNDTPRLNQAVKETYTDVNGSGITLSNPVQYLRKGAGEGLIHLSFESGDKEYIAKWSVARAYKRADGNFQKIEWTVEEEGSSFDKKGTEIEGIIGLGFEEFRRTVMLAQGEFTAFLKSKNDEKTRILEKITGTGVYKEIGHRITEHYKNAQKEYDIKEQSIANLKARLLDDDTVDKLKTEIAAMSAEVEKKQDVRTKLEKLKSIKEQEYETLNEITVYSKTLDETEIEFSRLSGGLKFAINAQTEKLSEYKDICKFVEENSSRDSIYKDSKLIIKDLTDIKANEDSIFKKTVEADLSKKKCNVIETDLKIRKNAIEKDNAECSRIRAEIDRLSNERKLMDSNKLKSLKVILENVVKLEEDTKVISQQIAENDKKKIELNAKVKEFHSVYDAALAHYNATNIIYEKMQQTNSDWAKEARASLQVGDECPVCGQKIPSQDYLNIISDSHFQSLLQPVKEEKNKAETERDKCFKVLSNAQAEAEVLDRLIIRQKKELTDNQNTITDLNSKKSCNMSLKTVNERLDKIDELSKLIDEYNREFLKWSGIVAKDKDEYNKLLVELESNRTKIESISRFINETIQKNNEIIALNNSRMGGPEWKYEWQSNKDGYITNLEKEADRYIGAINRKKELEDMLATFKEKLDAISGIKNNIIANTHKYAEVPEGNCVKIINQLNLWSNLATKIGSATSSLSNAEVKLKKLRSDLLETATSLSEYFAIRKIKMADIDKQGASMLLLNINKELSDLNEDIGSKKNQLSQNDKDKTLINNDLDTLKELLSSRDKWKSLNDVFGKKDGEYFQKIAQGFIMNDILSRANHYLKSITKRYVLESQNGSLEILIRDMEQGGIIRSTSTISGGESFIISLALALGLSSLGAGGNIHVDTLFIDEGFGTLSGEYLDTVTETLQKLNETGGKRVGIISHVKELRERIGAKITVTKINPTESKVTVSLV